MVFDKTGTVTEGNFSLLTTRGALPADEQLRLIASLEQSSNHPIACALVDAAKGKNLLLSETHAVRIVDGMGIEGMVEGKRVAAGNMRFILQSGFPIDESIRELTEREGESGNTVVFCGIEGIQTSGYFVLGDSIKPTSLKAIGQLSKLGVTTRLLSGDMEKTTAAVARRCRHRIVLGAGIAIRQNRNDKTITE